MTIGADPADPAEAASRAADLGTRVGAATQRLLQTAATLSDQQAGEPSLLPGWTRGHVLSHLARNADGLRNLLIWARTGVPNPQYASAEAREQGIQQGAGRPAAELYADVAAAAAAFATEASTLHDADWLVLVGDAAHPAWFALQRRLTEVEVHHVDLDSGYRPADWPADFAAELLLRVAGESFAAANSPAAMLRGSDSGRAYRIGPAGRPATVEITGPTSLLLAWLIGRSTGGGLSAEPAGPLPALPSW